MRSMLVAAVLALSACGGSSPVAPVQAGEPTVTPIPVAIGARECEGPPCISALGRSLPGGQAGNTGASLTVRRVAVAGTNTFEWALISVLDNHADSGENVAIYGQGRAYAGGPTWAGVFEVMDMGGAKQPNMLGVEVNLGVLRPHNGNQHGVHIVAHKRTGAQEAASGTSALMLDGGTAQWGTGIMLRGKVGSVIDLPGSLVSPPSGQHVGSIPIVIDGNRYWIAVYR